MDLRTQLVNGFFLIYKFYILCVRLFSSHFAPTPPPPLFWYSYARGSPPPLLGRDLIFERSLMLKTEINYMSVIFVGNMFKCPLNK